MPARVLCLTFVVFCSVSAMLSAQQFPHIVEDEPLTPTEQLERFHLPPGFEIQLVASEPQIAKPINLNFDAQGRLLVTQSLEYPVAVQSGSGRDAVLLLEDRDGDGRYESTAGRVAGLNIPIGVTPVDGGDVVAFSIPNILRAGDADGDGEFEQRQKLFGPFGQDDTHGLNNGFTRWLDGWIYACHGFRNSSTVAGQDGHEISMNSGNTYRFRADGSRIEQWTWGQVNPFGLTFDPLGNAYTADCHTKPMHQLLRGARYPSFGKPHDGLGFAPQLIEHSHGSTGIGGIAYYAAEHFPPEFRDVIFVGNPITHRVNCDRLARHGSTYRGEELPDFLVCDDPWFRPVDLQLGPDGALYVADFYNCIIGHYEVPLDHPRRDRHRGRIWRIVYTGDRDETTDPPKSQNLRTLDLVALWDKLADPNLTVRTLATHEIVDRFPDEARRQLPRLMGAKATPSQRAHGVWICERLGILNADLVRRLAQEPEVLPRVHVTKALADRLEWSPDEGELMRALLNDEDAFVRRAAVDGLARHPHADNIATLLELWQATPQTDTHLIHTVRMALRDQLKSLGPYDALLTKYGGQPQELSRLVDVSLGVRDAASADFVLAVLEKVGLDVARRDEYLQYVLLRIEDDRLADAVELIACERDDENRDETAQRQSDLLLVAARGFAERGKPSPASLRQWADSLAEHLLTHDDVAQIATGVRLAGELKLSASFDRLRDIVLDAKRPAALRGDALEACAASNAEAAIAPLVSMLSDARQPAALRSRAVTSLTDIARPEARDALAAQLPVAHFQLALEIAAGLGRNREGAEQLLSAVKQGKASPQLLMRREIQFVLNASGLPNWQQRIDDLTVGVTPLDQQAAELLAKRRGAYLAARGESVQGAALFKKTCAACHRLGKEGNKVGPELDGIGNRGLDRVLEDVLEPNRIVDPAFRTTVVQTVDGQVLSGLAIESEGETLVLVDREGKPRRIALADIEERRTLPLSPMPANLADAIPAEDFNHLLAYLLSQRQK